MTRQRQPYARALDRRAFALALSFRRWTRAGFVAAIVGSATALALLASASLCSASDYALSWSHPRPQGNALHGAAFADATTGYAVGDRGAVVRTTDGGQSWSLVTVFPDFAVDLEDLVILGNGDLLAAGASPGIFRSSDGGVTWSAVANPSIARLYDIELVAGATFCAVGDDGQVLRSTDSGATWSLLASPGGDLREQLWLDATNAYVMGTFRVRRTTDGGQSWLAVPGIPDTDNFTESFFIDAERGYILSDFNVWRTTDAGASWSGSQLPGSIVYLGNTIVLGEEHFLIASTIEGALVYETTDAGETWSFALNSGAGGFHDFDRLSDGTLVTVATEGDIFRSTDDGASWVNTIDAVAPPRAPQGAVAIGPGGMGAAGTTGSPGQQWYRTTDNGASWAIQPSGPAISFTSDIAWWNADAAVVAGDYGKVWRTTDGGASWVFAALPGAPTNGAAWHLSLPAPGIAFAGVTGQGQSLVYRTTDFGASWAPRSSGIGSAGSITSVSFFTADAGFACGYTSVGQPRVFRTTNGGGSWSPVGVSGLPGFPWDMHWHDAQVGLATVYLSGGGIFRTTNGGTSWQNVWPVPAYDLSFADALHGGAGVTQFDADGTVFLTEDGGATWESLVLPSTTAGATITATADGFLVGGAFGTIMRATRLDIVGVGGADLVADDAGGAPDRAAASSVRHRTLFARRSIGSSLEVCFALPAAGHAALAVFDLSGRRVALLTAGDFARDVLVSAPWDGARDDGTRASAGVYFAQLHFDGKAEAVKLTLVR